MRLLNKHDRDDSWDAWGEDNRRKEEEERKEKRIKYLKGEIASEGHLDGYVLQGHKEELKDLMDIHHKKYKPNEDLKSDSYPQY